MFKPYQIKLINYLDLDESDGDESSEEEDDFTVHDAVNRL